VIKNIKPNAIENMIRGKKIKIIFITLLCLLIIVSSLPIDGLGASRSFFGLFTFRVDHVAHFCIYATLSFIGFLAFGNGKKVKHLLLLFIGLLFFALLEEGHQKWIPLRDASWGDYFFDVLGIIAGTTSFFLFQWVQKVRYLKTIPQKNDD
jgi:hypothetical protein